MKLGHLWNLPHARQHQHLWASSYFVPWLLQPLRCGTVLGVPQLPHAAGWSNDMCSAAPTHADLMKDEKVFSIPWNMPVLVCNDGNQAAWGPLRDGKRLLSNAGLLPRSPECSSVAIRGVVLVLLYVDRCAVTAHVSSSILLSTASTLVPMECAVDRRSTVALPRLQ